MLMIIKKFQYWFHYGDYEGIWGDVDTLVNIGESKS